MIGRRGTLLRTLATALVVGALTFAQAGNSSAATRRRNPQSWKKDASNPVLVNTPGNPDKSFVGDPGVVFHDGTFYLYYPSAWQLRPDARPANTSPDEIALPISVSTSTDGVHFKPFDHGTPQPDDDYVLLRDSRRSWDAGSLETPTVLFDERDHLFKMWYSASIQTPDEQARAASFKIGYATSRDGFTWTKYDDPSTTDPAHARSDPVFGPSQGGFDNVRVSDPTVLLDGQTFKLWYSAIGDRNGSPEVTIGYAESSDGIHWKRHDRPVLVESRGEGFVAGPEVLKNGNRYEMWYYAGSKPGVFYATSRDGVHWKKRGVAVAPGKTGTWDDREASSPTVAIADGKDWLYYTGTSCPLEENRRPDRKDCQVHIAVGLATRPARPAG